jgi:hypothetical protein
MVTFNILKKNQYLKFHINFTLKAIYKISAADYHHKPNFAAVVK